MNFNSIESKILEILNLFGPLRPEQVIGLITKHCSEKDVEKALGRLRSLNLISNISGGYYIGLSSSDKVNKAMVESVWVLLYFISEVSAFKRAEYPAQITFSKKDMEYSIFRVKRGYEFLISDYVKCRPNERIVFVVDSFSDITRTEPFLSENVCVFAKLDYSKDVIPDVVFRFREGAGE